MASVRSTHVDGEMWGVTTYVKQLPGTSSPEYLAIEYGEGNEEL